MTNTNVDSAPQKNPVGEASVTASFFNNRTRSSYISCSTVTSSMNFVPGQKCICAFSPMQALT